MPRSRTALMPLVPGPREEDDGTWMLTFSDLVLLLLAFVAIGIMMERADGPHRITRHLRVAPVAPAAAPAPFVLVAETSATTDTGAPGASPLPAAPAADAEISGADAARLRGLARRLEMRLAAEGVAGLRPAVVEHAAVVVEVAAGNGVGRGATLRDTLAGLRPRLTSPAVAIVTRSAASAALAAESDRALARAARVAHELVAGDPLLAVHVAARPAPDRAADAPARLEVRLVGG